MKSRLLPIETLHSLANSKSSVQILGRLLGTPYRHAIETALARAPNTQAVGLALRVDLEDTLNRIRRFFDDRAQSLIATWFGYYDVQNLKSVLIGQVRHASPGDILSALVPAGDIAMSVWESLAGASNVREAIDLLASLRVPLARPLLRLRRRDAALELSDMEAALDAWYFSQAPDEFGSESADAATLRESLQLQADLTNLLTAIRVISGARAQALSNALELFVPAGRISPHRLANAVKLGRLEALIEGSLYERPLRAGLQLYRQTGRLSDLERQLLIFRTAWFERLIVRDPLGIGVFFGYLALKLREIRDLRWITQTVELRLDPRLIRAGLEAQG